MTRPPLFLRPGGTRESNCREAPQTQPVSIGVVYLIDSTLGKPLVFFLAGLAIPRLQSCRLVKRSRALRGRNLARNNQADGAPKAPAPLV